MAYWYVYVNTVWLVFVPCNKCTWNLKGIQCNTSTFTQWNSTSTRINEINNSTHTQWNNTSTFIRENNICTGTQGRQQHLYYIHKRKQHLYTNFWIHERRWEDAHEKFVFSQSIFVLGTYLCDRSKNVLKIMSLYEKPRYTISEKLTS